MGELTHFNKQGRARMVDVTEKAVTHRRAVAAGEIRVSPETMVHIKNGTLKKGDVLAVAQVAGIQAAKHNWELIPMCHPLPLTGIDITFRLSDEPCMVEIQAAITCTGGMSVDPDDNTPGGIQASGARIVTYGAPVLPGAMFLLGYFEDGTPICGLPGCVMYAGATIFDLALPRIAAGVELTRRDFAVMGEGGLCLGCKPCHWPNCPFGK